jgi:hypothetical protein
MVEPRTIEPRTAIVSVCRTYDAAIANHGIRIAVIAATTIVGRRVSAAVVPAVIGRLIAAIISVARAISVTRTVGVGARGYAAD